MTTPAVPLPHALHRRVVIRATPDVVFGFFTDSARWAEWWGAGSRIDPRAGGSLLIRYPDGTEVSGEVLDIRSPEQLVFTYGYVSGALIPPGGSRVTIRLAPFTEGTRLDLTHEFADEAVREEHEQGWRYQLSLFSTLISDTVNRDAGSTVDVWFDAWAEADPVARRRALATIAEPAVRFRDRYGNTDGIDDLMPHIAAAQKFMPGIRVRRTGQVRHCQGTVLADWTAGGPDGKAIARGTNVFALGPTGLIESVTGFWSTDPSPSNAGTQPPAA